MKLRLWKISRPSGRWRVRAKDASQALAAAALAEARLGSRVAEPAEFCGRPAWIKAGPLHGSSAWRHGLAAGLGIAPPRERELCNAVWLDARLFRVPEGLAAGALRAGPKLTYQFLILERLASLPDLERALSEAGPTERSALVSELALELARMHALGFAHGDLYPRNVLVRATSAAPGDPRRLVFLDAWRRSAQFRSSWLAHGRGESRWFARDLGCYMSYGAMLHPLEEQRLLLETYCRERALLGRPVRVRELLQRTQRAFDKEQARLALEPSRWRSSARPPRHWDALALDPAPVADPAPTSGKGRGPSTRT